MRSAVVKVTGIQYLNKGLIYKVNKVELTQQNCQRMWHWRDMAHCSDRQATHWPILGADIASKHQLFTWLIHKCCSITAYPADLVKWLRTHDSGAIPFVSGHRLRQLVTAKYTDAIWILWRSWLCRVHECRCRQNHLQQWQVTLLLQRAYNQRWQSKFKILKAVSHGLPLQDKRSVQYTES